ncbi:hypothetical protein PVAG01_05252 [Phlyctema vagabunda]|uniref:MYND-type domain-containing protein n=1 Tax=Phlyctema vagabunda TaxID=108571 RepID=A0ABR4PJM4_9HELO
MTENFSWDLPGLDGPQFIALASLLTLRNGGQIEPASLPDNDLEANSSGDESDTGSLDTLRPQRISKSGHGILKRKFLDALAELAANKKGGRFVACSAMREEEDSVTIWIARNEGFQQVDEVFFQRLRELLQLVGSNQDQETETALWFHMLDFYKVRLESTYIPDLRLSFKTHDQSGGAVTVERYSEAIKQLSVLRDLAFGYQQSGRSLLDGYDQLATQAYRLRGTRLVKELLSQSPGATTSSRKLWTSICSLGRLRVCYGTFKDIVNKLPSFADVKICLIPRAPVSKDPFQNTLTLKQTLEKLGLQLDLPTIQTILGHKWTVAKAEQQFKQLQKQKLNVHAEVQMVMFFSKMEETFTHLFRYFGCSKYSCFMCAHFLNAHGTFKTRGCHGRLFKPCIIPHTTGLAATQSAKLRDSVLQVQKDMRKELKRDFQKLRKHEKTSAVGGSTRFSGEEMKTVAANPAIEIRRMKAEQERVAAKFQRLELSEDNERRRRLAVENQQSFEKESNQETEYVDECSGCSRMTSRTCSVCGKGHFCSQSCEDKRSGFHLFTCTKRPITTADILYEDIADDKLPDSEDVLRDYGFNYFTSFADRSKLLGLYKGIWYSDEITAEDLHRWRVEGSLLAHIKEYFYSIPERYRGGYFPWFLNHTDCLDEPLTSQSANDKLVATFFDKAKSYLDVEDRNKELHQLEPEAKMLSYGMLACCTHAAHPNPIEQNWYNFGFCTCKDESSERSLGGLYQQLLLGDSLFEDTLGRLLPSHLKVKNTATFTEFWRAFESGSLISLMDSKGLKSPRHAFPHLEGFLSVSRRGLQPTVWRLKQYLAIDDPAEHEPPRPVWADYGFMNCRDFEETCILMEIYKRLLIKADPLDLHAACLKGNLFDFAQGFHKMNEKHRRLMRNFYHN